MGHLLLSHFVDKRTQFVHGVNVQFTKHGYSIWVLFPIETRAINESHLLERNQAVHVHVMQSLLHVWQLLISLLVCIFDTNKSCISGLTHGEEFFIPYYA